MKKKKLPMRKCIITNKMYLKRDLLRIVKNKDGEILVDSTGKASGRGAYVIADLEIIRNVQLVDVREKDEFMYAHINGARNIPMSQINFKCMSLLKDKPIYLCDKNGTLSPRAALTLRKNGYSDI